MKMAALYARVSSERQKEEQTIGSQTEALKEHAKAGGYTVLTEWIFQDEGYSGAILQRPGLERLRDLAAEGQIEAVLIYSPDRLSRKYAYQVLLIEEFARQGVEVIFIKSPQASTPEEELLVQFQGMIAEYERAQIAERSRRGKRHRARNGSVNVLSGAPYGYRYIKKSEASAAYYEIIEGEAEVVRNIFSWYTEETSSMGEISRRLTTLGIATRREKSTWDRSTVWGILRNPAYKGTACFGKTERAERKKITRPLRKRGGFSARNSSSRERPKEQWIEIFVPPIISEDIFSLAQERLEKNKQFSRRHTKEPTLLQGLLVCSKCGYAFYRTSTRTSKRKIYYYRCLGSDDYRYPNGRVCTNRPIRQDYLDELVWKHVIKLFESPDLIHKEINRRIHDARKSNPTRMRKESLAKENARVQNGIDRLLDAYQEGLLQIPELRKRMQELRKRQSSLGSELQALEAKTIDDETYLQLVGKIDDFLSRMRRSAETLNVLDRQKILRLVIKEILVDMDTVTIKHSIPTATTFSEPTAPSFPSGHSNVPSYLLCGRSNHPTLRRAFIPIQQCAIRLLHRSFQPPFNVQKYPSTIGMFPHRPHHQLVVKIVEKPLNVEVYHPITSPAPFPRCPYRIQCRFPRTMPVGIRMEAWLNQRLKVHRAYHLSNAVSHCGDSKNPFPTVGFQYWNCSHRRGHITSRCHSIPEFVEIVFQLLLKLAYRYLIDPCRTLVCFYPQIRFPNCLLGNTKRFCFTQRFLPFLVDSQIKLNNATPSLHSHYRNFSAITSCSAPVLRIGTLILGDLPLELLPCHQSDRFPQFHTRARIRLAPPSCRTPSIQ